MFLTTVAVEPTFVAFLRHSQTYVHGLSCHYFKFLWRTVDSKPHTMPFGIVACTFSDNFLEIPVYKKCAARPRPLFCLLSLLLFCYTECCRCRRPSSDLAPSDEVWQELGQNSSPKSAPQYNSAQHWPTLTRKLKWPIAVVFIVVFLILVVT